MPITVQNVADAVNYNCREYFGPVSTGVPVALSDTLFTVWTEIIQQDILHNSIWSRIIHSAGTFTSSPGGSPYTLAETNIRRFEGVYDLANRRWLVPAEELNYPAGSGSPPERSGPPRIKPEQIQQANAPYPQYYFVEVAGTTPDALTWKIHLISDPDTTDYSGTIRYFFLAHAPTLVDHTSELVLPLDATDVTVAGVTMLTMRFLKRATDAQWWQAVYEGMKRAGLVYA